MMKPRKTWSVGDKTFETYEEALREANACRRTKLFDDVFNVVYDRYGSKPTPAADMRGIVEGLFANFNITRKKGTSLGQESETASQK